MYQLRWSFDTVWSSASEHGTGSLLDPVVKTTLIIFLYGPSFYTGKEPLCSLGICISQGQMLKVREWTKITHNMNAAEQTCACVREKRWLTAAHVILWQAFFYSETFLELLTLTHVLKDSWNSSILQTFVKVRVKHLFVLLDVVFFDCHYLHEKPHYHPKYQEHWAPGTTFPETERNPSARGLKTCRG